MPSAKSSGAASQNDFGTGWMKAAGAFNGLPREPRNTDSDYGSICFPGVSQQHFSGKQI
jgi:hypothetical protein